VSTAPGRRRARVTLDQIAQLHDDARLSAARAGLLYIEGDPPGITRRRSGRGFSYRDASSQLITDPVLKEWIVALAIPPAWRNVWICATTDGHILATGEDDRGRKQYIYHPRWRELRDLINFYRLIVVAEALPPVRTFIRTQLKRRTLDRPRVIAGMLAILDAALIRIGSEIYAEENESFGLTTLGPDHLTLTSRAAKLSFTAKSGKAAELTLTDPGVVRLLRELATAAEAGSSDRLFAVDGVGVDADEVNATLAELTGEHITAKDFRTWGGTLRAFSLLRVAARHGPVTDETVLAAIDSASEALGNTRAVARAHYVHPDVVEAFRNGSAEAALAKLRARRTPLLTRDEQVLAAFLTELFGVAFARPL
jgi:DNA topoisomerase-1